MSFPPVVRRRVVLRSFAIQGSWNYETLIGTGFAFTLLPALRYIYGADREALRAAVARHSEVFNSHPYLATVAAGAIARLEADGADPRLVDRFKSALRGSLGSLGDQLVWSAWRPACILIGLILMLAGAAWWVAVSVFLIVYNALNVGLRVWGWNLGTRAGLDVGRALREAPLHALAHRAADAGAALAGFALVLAAAGGPRGPAALSVYLAAAGLGAWLGARSRQLFAAIIALVWVFALAWGWSR